MLAPRHRAAICLGTALCGLAALAVAAATGGLSPSFIDPDESAHYVNALFLGDWLRAGLPAPMDFARSFYAHFPKLSIGHWPPGWYALLAPVFAVLRPSPLAATALSAFVAGLPAVVILWAGRRCGCVRASWLAATAYLLLPIVVDGARHFLLDQPVALVAGLAAISWLRATERPGWRRLLVFAALADAAVLVKGNGALVALVPAIDIALTRRWVLLRTPALWGAAAIAAAVVVPWYWLSFKIAAGGFNYAPGPAYAWLALTSNLRAVIANVGWAGVLLAVAGAGSAYAGREAAPGPARVAALAGAVVLATLVFQSAIPAAIEPRYVAPLLPWLLVLTMLGATVLWRRRSALARGAAVLLVAAASMPACIGFAGLAAKTDLAAPALAETMRAHPGTWLVDGRAGDEGAVIAAAAFADGGARRISVARASQWLSTSDFMGRGYRVTAPTPAAASAVLDRLGVAGVVSIARGGGLAYPHSAILRAALVPPAFTTASSTFPKGAGHMLVAVRSLPVAAMKSPAARSADLAKISAPWK